MKRTVLSALLASVLVLSGCGNSEEDEAKTAISDYLMQQQENQQMITLKEEEADCISDGMVDGIGVDKLKEYGFLNEDGSVNENAETPDMSQGDAETMVDSMFDCTNVMTTMREELAKSMGDQPAEVKDCIEDALTEDAVRDMLVATFAGNQEEAGKALMGPLMKCATGGTDLPQE
jgi:hypothetical protein